MACPLLIWGNGYSGQCLPASVAVILSSKRSLPGIVPCEKVQVKHAHGLTDQLPLAAMQPQREVLPVHDAFMTLPAHTSSRKDDVQSVGSGVMRHSTRQMACRELCDEKIQRNQCSEKGMTECSIQTNKPNPYLLPRTPRSHPHSIHDTGEACGPQRSSA